MTTILIPPPTVEPTGHDPAAPSLDPKGASRREGSTVIAGAGPEPSVAAVVRDLSRIFASPVHDDADRRRRREALALLVGDSGLGASRLVPTAATPDVVVDRIAGWALARLDGCHRAAALAAREELRAG